MLGLLAHVHDPRTGRHRCRLAAIGAVTHHYRTGALRKSRRGIG
ncbi:hypothetical protein DHOM_09630 [Dermabacter hominis 1368]|uniref:Uncharacterized protein n=1 Tax=Dermabacter hominis 1368 TaxID=1450519 RepID=A0ABR4SHN8_9MICO|nr:hypothetical protein DHOM_09630 [Dermabacter hominis 1368]